MLIHELKKNEIPTASGIYRIRFWNDGGFVPVCRAAKKDSDGIIYIGTSQNLQKRIWMFRRVIFNDYVVTQGHVAANRYVRVEAIHKTFPPQNLWFEWNEVADYEVAEADELMAYMKKYAELPPLNYGAPYNSLSDKLGAPQGFPIP